MCIILDDVVVAQHVRQRKIALSVLELRITGLIVNAQFTPRKAREILTDVFHAFFNTRIHTVNQLRHRHRASINHGINRAVIIAVER